MSTLRADVFGWVHRVFSHILFKYKVPDSQLLLKAPPPWPSLLVSESIRRLTRTLKGVYHEHFCLKKNDEQLGGQILSYSGAIKTQKE